ncbi:MAG: Kef family K(+) transporter [Telmatospirillum sp.]|nr:Kef family K(+) transporter [Telmatospirillum sp.]
MPHGSPLLTTFVAAIGLAFLFGAIANRLRLPPLLGYLAAGIIVGPFTPGFVADQTLAPELAEIGIILLMFGVGLHFSLKDLLSVGLIAIPGAIVQIGAATLMGYGLGSLLGWTETGALVFGLALSVASTVVLLKALQAGRLMETDGGRTAVGWLVVEDLVMVLVLVLLPALAGLTAEQSPAAPSWIADRLPSGLGGAVLVTGCKVAAFLGVMMVVGRRVIPWILHSVAQRGSRELFRLAVLAIALTVAFGAARLFGVSMALGGFFAGMVLSESELSHQAAEDSLPLRDAFAVLFFVSAGMLFDPAILLREPLPVLATLGIILFGKSLAAFLIVLMFRRPVSTALTISASLAQIGEFSFILADHAVSLGLMPGRARSLMLAGAILSIMVNPLMFWAAKRLSRRLDRPKTGEGDGAASPATPPPPTPDPAVADMSGHVVLVGFGRVGALVGDTLRQQEMPLLVIEDAGQIAQNCRAAGIPVIDGNGADHRVLEAAAIDRAGHLVVAIPNAFEAGHIIAQARESNPSLRILARAHSDAEVAHLTAKGADLVIMGEREIARSLSAALLNGPEAAA